MPEVLDYFRQKDPRFKDVPDRELSDYIKEKYPEFRKELMYQKPRTAFQKKAASQKLGIEVEQTKAGYEQDIAQAKSEFAGTMATAIPTAATLGVGGLAAPAAIGLMGLSGLVGGAYREAAQVALGATPSTEKPEDVAKRLGIDALFAGGAEGAVRVGGQLLKLGGRNIIEPLVARASAKSDAGVRVLQDYGTRLMNKLRDSESFAAAQKTQITPSVETALSFPSVTAQRPLKGTAAHKIATDIDTTLNDFVARLAIRGTGQSQAFETWAKGISKKLTLWDGSLSQLTEIKGDLSQAAYRLKAVNYEEGNALKKFAEGVDKKLLAEWKAIGAEADYRGWKRVRSQTEELHVALETASTFMHNFARHIGYRSLTAGLGATAGGTYGYRSGGVMGAAAGAATGAALGVGFAAVTEKAGPWLLERMLRDTTTAPPIRAAIKQAMDGNTKKAVDTFTRAVMQSDVVPPLKQYLKELAEEQQKSQEAPNAAPSR